MSKGIILTPTQIKAKEAGATMFLFGIRNIEYYDFLDNGIYNVSNPMFRKDRSWSYSDFITDYAPIHHGDKDIFVQEEFFEIANGDLKYKYRDYNENSKFNKIELWIPASQMTKEQSRYSFSECIDVKVVRLREVTPDEFIKSGIITRYEFEEYGFELIKTKVNQQLKEQNINRTYEDNDYVFLVEFKK